MSDQKTTLQQLKDRVRTFVRERDWEKYHSPKNLSMALAVEASELMELYQWKSMEEADALHEIPEKQKAIEEEVADITAYLLEMCNVLEIDLASAFENKMKLNAIKYPIEQENAKHNES